MKNLNNILLDLLIIDQNETCILTAENYNIFKSLVVEIMKVKYDIRFCSNENCSCHPEKQIENILKTNKELVSFLKQEKLYDDIIYLINHSDQSKINKYIFGEE